jgi:hypothetical protein
MSECIALDPPLALDDEIFINFVTYEHALKFESPTPQKFHISISTKLYHDDSENSPNNKSRDFKSEATNC